MPTARNTPRDSTVMKMARQFYGEGLEVSTKRELSESLKEWVDRSDAEQRFVLAHLHYMNLVALNNLIKDLREVREEQRALRGRLEGELDSLGAALMMATTQVAGDGEGPEPSPEVQGEPDADLSFSGPELDEDPDAGEGFAGEEDDGLPEDLDEEDEDDDSEDGS